MTETSFQLSQPGTFADPLTEVLRSGARALLTQAVEAEVAALLSCHADKLTDDGRQRLVRHGHLPEREIVIAKAPGPAEETVARCLARIFQQPDAGTWTECESRARSTHCFNSP